MKTTLMLRGAVGALVLALAVPALAAPNPPPPPAPPSAQAGPGQFGPGQRGPGRFGQRGEGPRRQRATPEERAKRRAEQFARMDTNRDGRVTEPEFHAYLEARKREREHRLFQRFSGGQDSVTLDQFNARALTREKEMRQRFQDRRGGPRGGQRGGPDGARPQGGFDGRDFPSSPPPPPARPNS